jgi:hypothetical protein
LINSEQIGSKLRLTLGDTLYRLRRVEAASGTR